MSSNRALLAATTIASLLSVIALTKATATNTANSNYITRAELPAVIKDTLAKNPELVIDALKKLREQQGQEGEKDVKAAFEKYKGELYTDSSVPSTGNPKGDITLVEFFDYHCGYCKRMLPVFEQLVKEDSNVHISFREFPILSEDSKLAARAALAFNRLNKEKYFEYHAALMGMKGRYDEKNLGDMAAKFGVPADDLVKEMKKPEITAILDKNRQMAADFGIRGTPAILIGGQLLPGAMGHDDLKAVIADIRSKK